MYTTKGGAFPCAPSVCAGADGAAAIDASSACTDESADSAGTTDSAGTAAAGFFGDGELAGGGRIGELLSVAMETSAAPPGFVVSSAIRSTMSVAPARTRAAHGGAR